MFIQDKNRLTEKTSLWSPKGRGKWGGADERYARFLDTNCYRVVAVFTQLLYIKKISNKYSL